VNIVSMVDEVETIANPVIGESSLPNLSGSTDDCAEIVRVRTFDELDRTFNRNVPRGRQKKMNMLGHNDESVQGVSSLATIAIDRLQKKPDVPFDCKQLSAVESREGYEVSSGRGDESSRFQGETSAAGSRMSPLTLDWHEWNSCASRLFFVQAFSFWERPRG